MAVVAVVVKAADPLAGAGVRTVAEAVSTLGDPPVTRVTTLNWSGTGVPAGALVTLAGT